MNIKTIILFISAIAVAVPLYWQVLKTAAARKSFLLILSMAMVYCLQPAGMLSCAGLSVILYGLCRRKSYAAAKAAAFILPLGYLLFFKSLAPLANTRWGLPAVFIPLGISYSVFKMLHYVIECRRDSLAVHSMADFMLYIFFFPMFLAGPIERFPAFHENLSRSVAMEKTPSMQLSRGMERILTGVFKKVILADFLLKALMPDDLYFLSGGPMAWHALLTASSLKFLYIYMDFSGYIDMAIGIGLLFGIKLMENFNRPLIQPNIAGFWRSWHISLSGWARDYVYYPVMLKTRNVSAAITATMLTIGVWHGLGISWVLWGLHHALGLIAYSRLKRAVFRAMPSLKNRHSMPFKILGIVSVWFFLALGHSLHLCTVERFNGAYVNLKIYLTLLTFGWIR
jgi:alginate O-acetyltransferase complex protein AlgI